MTDALTAHVVVPVADVEDARRTMSALAPYEINELTAIHIVEKGGGVPDKTPVEQSESVADASFEAVRKEFPEAQTAIRYGTDVVETVIDFAGDVEASAIVFQPRGGSRVTQFLAGDRALRLITQADRPVIALPIGQENE